jgi:PhnB protein
MQLQPYLFFDGRCDEAIDFYKRAVGAEVVMLMRFKDTPASAPRMHTPEMAERVMHARLRIGDATVFVSDGRCGGRPKFDGFSLSITVPTAADADRVFAALNDGGQVIMPIGQTFFSPRFGMLADRFGVPWQVIAEK